MKGISILLVALLMVMGLSATAHSDLIVRGTDTLGNQLIYDTDFDITWYDYSKSFNTWSIQMNWADSLTVDFGGTVFDDWRLPTALNQDGTGPCSGFDCTDSEMGHLYYTELENPVGGPLTSTGSFVDLQSAYYWSGTVDSSDPSLIWVFGIFNGRQDTNVYYNYSHALAVRDGDVSAVSIPEPETMLLLCMGLAGIALVRKRFGRIHR